MKKLNYLIKKDPRIKRVYDSEKSNENQANNYFCGDCRHRNNNYWIFI